MSALEKILLAIGGVALVLLVITLGFRYFRTAQDKANEMGNQLDSTIASAIELKYTQYDGLTISGSQVVGLIKDTYAASDYIQIGVKTSAGTSTVAFVTDRAIGATTAGPGIKSSATYTAAIANAENKTNANYIAPTGKFKGALTRDANGTIVEIVFTQQ